MKNETIEHIEAGPMVGPCENPITHFFKQEKLGHVSLGLDVVRKRLLVSGMINRVCRSFQVQLNDVRQISIKKAYSNIYSGQLKKRRLEEFLEAIYLQFEFLDGRQTIHVPVFDRALDSLPDLPETEKKALYWQDLLSELLSLKDRREK